jgi:uncharacterized protein YndB with AHSA1/START domain
MSENTLHVTHSIHAAPAEVCRGFTHATLLRDWLCNASSVEAHTAGHLFLRWRDGRTVTGTYEHIDPPRGVRFTWLDTDLGAPSVVTVTCAPEGGGSLLTLLIGCSAIEQTGNVGAMEAFWVQALENLASVLETGIDLRLARRPRLGIGMDEFTPQVAQKLGVPVSAGVLVAATAEGSGARAAGLQTGDVLISLNGHPLASPHSLDVALRGLKAGDQPVVEYYRGPERHSVPLKLGSFPILDLPASAGELADKVRELNAEILAAIRVQVEGLSEVQANARPAEGEWSVNELVAHFVLAQRDYQGWVADMINDVPVEDWLMNRSNLPARITALTATLRTLPALLDELAQAQAETAAMIASFPESFVSQRKHLYRRAAGWELQEIRDHYYQEHQEQFRKTIEVSRGQ